jgi:hypothetical protein
MVQIPDFSKKSGISRSEAASPLQEFAANFGYSQSTGGLILPEKHPFPLGD